MEVNNNKEKFTLLMTACIAPQKANREHYELKRVDPKVRLEDYKKALSYWLSYDDSRVTGIVFIENSGYPLDELKNLALHSNFQNRQVEFLQYEQTSIPDGLHYGYSELEMIDNAFDDSKLLKSSNWMIKTTGRLYFPKLSSLLDFVQSKTACEVLTDSRDFKIGLKEQHYIVTTLFFAKNSFYHDELYNARAKMTPDYCSMMEHLYFAVLKPYFLKNKDKAILRFPFNVDPVGVGAHANVDYGSVKKKLMASFRGITRQVMPKFWI